MENGGVVQLVAPCKAKKAEGGRAEVEREPKNRRRLCAGGEKRTFNKRSYITSARRGDQRGERSVSIT
jgi:hypothetical protein